MSSSKKFITVYSLTAGGGILAVVLVIFLIDPFFHYHMPWFGLKPVVTEPLPAKAGRFDLLLKQPEVVRALLYAFVL